MKFKHGIEYSGSANEVRDDTEVRVSTLTDIDSDDSEPSIANGDITAQ